MMASYRFFHELPRQVHLSHMPRRVLVEVLPELLLYDTYHVVACADFIMKRGFRFANPLTSPRLYVFSVMKNMTCCYCS